MTATWRAIRATVRRRRVQTFVIGLVVLVSAATATVALTLISAASRPFDRSFDAQHGAHLVLVLDATKAPAVPPPVDRSAGVQAVAGPFPRAVLNLPADSGDAVGLGALTVVGRADPGGPVDRLDLWAGRWATAPGEIVLNAAPSDAESGPGRLGARIEVPGRSALTIVGRAYSVSQTADAWVPPDQIVALGPTTAQVLYRFADADTPAAVAAHASAVTDGLPQGALLGSQSWLTVRQAVAAGPGAYIPFLTTFGLLGLAVAILIIGNVVSGAVVSGFRHIGVLKALGFTPRQVVLVYLSIALLPAMVATVLGTGLGYLVARSVLSDAFSGSGFGGNVGVAWWVPVVVLVAVPAVVVVAALVPAARAYRLSAAEAISAGSAPRAGRGLGVQRWLSGTRLPRAVSLGLGQPFARPARTALTLAAVVLGVATVVLAGGLAATVSRYAEVSDVNNAAPIAMRPGNPAFGQVAPELDAAQTEALLRALPGVAHLSVSTVVPVTIAGQTRTMSGGFLRGDTDAGLAGMIVEGRWLRGEDEIVVPTAVLNERGFGVGEDVALQFGERIRKVSIVGATLSSGVGSADFFAGWQTLDALAPGYQLPSSDLFYQIEQAPGTDVTDLVRRVNAATPGLYAWDNRGTNSFSSSVLSLSITLSVLLGLVAALGVLNTVLLTVRERRRDLGILKSIGMRPSQVVTMTVVSMAALGIFGGLLGTPLGVLAHRLIVPLTARAAQIDTPGFLLNVWNVPVVLLLPLAGLVIATIGALLPARSAARLPIGQVLRSE